MKRFTLSLLLFAAVTAMTSPLAAQNTPSTAELIAERREMEERNKQMQSDLQQVLTTQLLLQKRIAALEEDMRAQKAANASDAGRYLTRDDLKRLDTDLVKLSTSIKEVDKNREADKKLMLETLEQMRTVIEEMRKLIKVAAHVTLPPAPKAAPKNDKTDETPAPTADKPEKIKAFTHKVASGENLSVIIKAYNDKLKEEGVTKRITLDMVLKANPSLKPERMQIGQEILIPDPRN